MFVLSVEKGNQEILLKSTFNIDFFMHDFSWVVWSKSSQKSHWLKPLVVVAGWLVWHVGSLVCVLS
jgi:hypothetical protein